MTNQYYSKLHLPFGLMLSFALTTNISASAQVTPDETLGTQVIDIGRNSFIFNGTTVGNTNLFHSFSSFSIPNGGAAIFFNDSSIINILARVTGGLPSNIQGVINTQGTANLFLLNPNGIIFGENARLNVGGSFVATTANAIQFPGGAEFSLTSPVTPNNELLSINPTAFLFNQIANQGANSIENYSTFLLVPDNKSLILLGGNVTPTPESTGQILMDAGRIGAFGGRVEIGGLNAPGSVGINVNGDNLSLSFPQDIARTDITLINNAAAVAFGGGGGDVVVNANNLSLVNSSSLNAGILPNQGNPDTKSGDISINATGIVTVAQGSNLGNISSGIGNSGDINIVAQSLQLINGSTINASATQGNSGTINIEVDNTVFLSGINDEFVNSSILAGGINIQAQNLLLADNAVISTTNFLTNTSGDINITTTDSINLNNFSSIFTANLGGNKAGNLSITTNDLNLENNSQISSGAFGRFGSGNGGNINITARNISIDNSDISASAFSFPEVISNVGNGGNIKIVTERITLTNLGAIASNSGAPEPGETIGFGGDINITATDLIEIDTKGAKDRITGINTRTLSSSSAGNITLNTKNLIVRDGGIITTEAANNLGGDAGNIIINASDSIELISSNINSPSAIFTGVEAFDNDVIAVGDGGKLTINTKFLQLTNAFISSGTFGKGNAGNISIFSNEQVIVDNGVINSRVGSRGVGDAGEINIQTQRLTLVNGGAIDSAIFRAVGDLPGGQGRGGNIRINATNAVSISGTDANGISSSISTETQTGAFGQGGDIIINTDDFRITDKGIISSITQNSSNAGNVTVNARVAEILNGGFVVTGTDGSGKAGDITINARDKITIATNTNLDRSTGLFAGTISRGDGGTISLFTTDFNLSAINSNFPTPVTISTLSQGEGIAGNINIIATNNYAANNGLVTARSEQSGGGNINISSKNIRLRNNSDIRTDLSTGQRSGGNIFLSADTIIALEDSDILAFASEGQGGDIIFSTRALFSDALYNPTQTLADSNSLQSLNNNNRSDINATGVISGDIIGVPDITFIENSLTELQSNPIDTNNLIANSCIARNQKQKGTFLITGAGGLPRRPGDASGSTYATSDVQNVTVNDETQQWKKGDLIIEPQGVYRLENGQLVMSRECD
ncbi:two-partner secretion domain-containing protein [Nostoc linckia]|nr:filamentous hemagglutinin N-terminal domain-containing protein [Nostoc linckia]